MVGTHAHAFKEWAATEALTVSAPLEQLRNRRLAIDAEDFLVGILTAPPTREPLLPALGGLPFALQNRVDKEITGFREAGIEPFFVFNGLDLACRDRASVLKESRRATQTLNEAWSVYDQGRGEDAVNNFGKACTYRIYHIMRSMHAHLHSLGVSVQTAPYSAAAQMVQYEREGFVDAVCGSVSCLLFGMDKVITTLDFPEKRFLWVTMKNCLAKTSLSQWQFEDMCLLSGASILSVFPELDSDSSSSKIPAARGAMARHGNDGANVVRKDEAYQMLFHRARFALRHPVVIHADGKVEPIGWEEGPSDAHEFIGQRLPEEIYHYLSRGLVGPRFLNWRTQMEILETPPLDGGSSQIYKDVVQDKLKPIRAQTLALITHSIHRYYQNTDVGLVCWFNDAERRSLNLRDFTEPSKTADTWHVTTEHLPDGADLEIDFPPVTYAILALANESDAKATNSSRQASDARLLKDQKELRANAVWRFLADRGYLNPDHTLSSWGQVLSAALTHANDAGSATQEMEEVVLMALELLRLDLLNKKHLFPTPPYSGAPIRGSDTDKANTLLISRVAALGAFQHGSIGYTGPLSRHLLAYGQLAAVVRGALRDLIEAHACNMFLSGAVQRDIPTSEITQLGTLLPFVKEPDLGLGLVVKSFLDERSNDPAKRQDITKWFNHAQDIPADLRKAWRLWGAVNAGIQAADDKTITADVKKSFSSADEWLQEKLKPAEGANDANGAA